MVWHGLTREGKGREGKGREGKGRNGLEWNGMEWNGAGNVGCLCAYCLEMEWEGQATCQDERRDWSRITRRAWVLADGAGDGVSCEGLASRSCAAHPCGPASPSAGHVPMLPGGRLLSLARSLTRSGDPRYGRPRVRPRPAQPVEVSSGPPPGVTALDSACNSLLRVRSPSHMVFWWRGQCQLQSDPRVATLICKLAFLFCEFATLSASSPLFLRVRCLLALSCLDGFPLRGRRTRRGRGGPPPSLALPSGRTISKAQRVITPRIECEHLSPRIMHCNPGDRGQRLRCAAH
jgi:hypothetical protein